MHDVTGLHAPILVFMRGVTRHCYNTVYVENPPHRTEPLPTTLVHGTGTLPQEVERSSETEGAVTTGGYLF